MGFPLKIPVKFKTETNSSLSAYHEFMMSMEFSIRPYAAARIAFLHRMIYRYRKTIFIFLFCSCLLLINHIYPVIHIVPPFSSKSQSNPHPNTHFISTQTFKEQILKLSVLNATIDSLKKSNTHILDLLNHQDLNIEQKNALRKCGYMAIRSVKQLQEANRQLNKANIVDQHTCLQQFSHVGMIDHHEGIRSEGQSLLISFVFDLKIPIFLNLSHSLEMVQEIEKDCREMLEMVKLSQSDSEL